MVSYEDATPPAAEVATTQAPLRDLCPSADEGTELRPGRESVIFSDRVRRLIPSQPHV
jgi:hypothetical protein